MFIGIDLGGTNIAIGIVDYDGNVKYEDFIPTKSVRGAEAIIEDMKDLVLKAIKNYGVRKKDIEAIGIGIPGLADKDGKVILCVNLKWKNVLLRQILEEELDIPVYMDNDATVAALAEYECGAMKGTESAVMLTLGTGIGGGIIFDGKVYSGYNGVGSELGHMVVGDNYYDCNCGRNGCLETFASSAAIIKYCEKLLKERDEKSIITEKINNDFKNLNGEIIFNCAKEGDFIANLVVRRLVKYLATGILNLINIIDPEVIALGGGVANAGEYLLDMLVKEVYENKYYKNLNIGKIVLSELGNKAGIIGAAMVGKKGYEQSLRV